MEQRLILTFQILSSSAIFERESIYASLGKALPSYYQLINRVSGSEIKSPFRRFRVKEQSVSALSRRQAFHSEKRSRFIKEASERVRGSDMPVLRNDRAMLQL
jgi:hypothetical protein